MVTDSETESELDILDQGLATKMSSWRRYIKHAIDSVKAAILAGMANLLDCKLDTLVERLVEVTASEIFELATLNKDF